MTSCAAGCPAGERTSNARQTLTLARLDGAGHANHPLLDRLPDGPHLLRRQPAGLSPPPRELDRHYLRPSLREVSIGFAGRFYPAHPVHAALARLVPGAPLTLRRRNHGWAMLDDHDIVAGMTARGFAPPSLRETVPARVRCVLAWDKEHNDARYGPLRCERWEVPLPELVVEG